MEPEEQNIPSPPEHEEVVPESNEPGHPEAASKSNRVIAIGLAVLLLGAPMLYLALRSSSAAPDNGMAAGAKAKPDLASLEAAEQASPTNANKLNLAAAYINGQQTPRAVPLLDSVLATDPKNAIAWNNYCVVHIQQQDYPSALKACGNAIASDPNFELPKNNLRWASSEIQKTKAVLDGDEKTPLASRSAEVDLRDGLGYLHLGQFDGAIAAFQAQLVLQPNSSIAANNIGTTYMLKHDPVRAIDWFQKAIAFDPKSQIAKNNLAWAKGELSKSQE